MGRPSVVWRAGVFVGAVLIAIASPFGCGSSGRAQTDDGNGSYRLGCTQTDANHSSRCLCASTDDLSNIVDGPYLEHVLVSPERKLDYTPLNRLAHLRSVTVDSDYPIDLNGLTKLDHLQELTVEARGSDFRPVGTMKQLVKLTLIELGDRGPKSKATDLTFLEGLENLHELDVSRVRVLDFSWLAHLDKLEKLRIHCASCEDAPGLAKYREQNPALIDAATHRTAIDFGSGGPQEVCAIEPGGCRKGPMCEHPPSDPNNR